MEYTLSDIDTMYREHIIFLDRNTRISYCKSIIDKAELNLNSSQSISSELNKYLQNILFAAQNELKAILEKTV